MEEKRRSRGSRTYLEVIEGDNLGEPTFTTSVPIQVFLERGVTYSPGNINNTDDKTKIDITGEATQRDLNDAHKKALTRFIMKSLVSVVAKNTWGAPERAIDHLDEKERVERGLKRKQKICNDRDNGGIEIWNLIKSLGETSYGALQPITCCIDATYDEITQGDKGIMEHLPSGPSQLASVYRLELKPKHLRWRIIDGNHRCESLREFRHWITALLQDRRYPNPRDFFGWEPDDYSPKRPKLTLGELNFWYMVDETFHGSQVKIELHLGLHNNQQQQLFSHLNNNSKPVPQSTTDKFDKDNPLKNFVKRLFSDNKKYPNLNFYDTTRASDNRDWQGEDDDGSLMLKDAITITAICMLGVTSAKSATPRSVDKTEKMATEMWEAINGIPDFGTKNHRSKTVAAQPVFLKGIARLVRELSDEKVKPEEQKIENKKSLNKLFNALKSKELNCSHNEPIWQALFLESDSAREKKHPGINKYVFVSPHINLDAGNYDKEKKWVRYGSRHNDIYKRLGDLMRFKLGLKERDQTKAKNQSLALSNRNSKDESKKK